MAIPNAPCKDCERREVGCHGQCGEYQEFVRECYAYREAKYREYEKDSWIGVRLKSIDRAKKRNRK